MHTHITVLYSMHFIYLLYFKIQHTVHYDFIIIIIIVFVRCPHNQFVHKNIYN